MKSFEIAVLVVLAAFVMSALALEATRGHLDKTHRLNGKTAPTLSYVACLHDWMVFLCLRVYADQYDVVFAP